MRRPDSLVEWEVSICAQTRVEYDQITFFGLVLKLMSQLNLIRECGASLRSGERDGRAGRESGAGERGGSAGRESGAGEQGARAGWRARCGQLIVTRIVVPSSDPICIESSCKRSKRGGATGECLFVRNTTKPALKFYHSDRSIATLQLPPIFFIDTRFSVICTSN